MKKFNGLLVQEYRHYGLSNYVMAGLVAIFVFLGPVLIVQFLPNTTYSVAYIRFTICVVSAVFTAIYAVGMFSSSLNQDVKQKELWLHNSQSIHALIGAKIVYHGVNMIGLCFVAFLGFFFVDDLIIGTFVQYLFFGFGALLIMVTIYIFLIIFGLFLIAVNIQISRYIGKLSYVVLFLVILVFFEIIEHLPTFTLLNVGKVELSNLNRFLPTFADNTMTVSLYIDFYILEEIFVGLILVLIYMFVCKWIERVITR